MKTTEADVEQLKQLNERLIQDKKEMEGEFKQILLALVDEVENQMEIDLGEYNGYEELKAALLKAESPKKQLMLQQQMIEEQEKMMKKQEKTIEDLKIVIETLKKKLTRLENSKLGKLQRKWWNLRKKFRS